MANLPGERSHHFAHRSIQATDSAGGGCTGGRRRHPRHSVYNHIRRLEVRKCDISMLDPGAD